VGNNAVVHDAAIEFVGMTGSPIRPVVVWEEGETK
jgi:hypothetical protein